jgi:cytochrome c oxidase subunit 2
MDGAEKLVLGIASCMLVLFLSATVYAVVGLDIDLPTCITSMEPFESGEVIEHTEDRWEIHYLAMMWEFEPEEIEIPLGTTVDLYLTSDDVLHGFQILGTNVNLMAVPGTVNYARVRFDKPGDYRIICHEYCGVEHHSMAATITVVEVPG